MKAQYTSNLVWYSVDNISTWVVGAMYLIGLWMLARLWQIGTLIAISSYAWRFWQPILNLSNPVQHLHQRRGLPGAYLRDD